MNAANTMLELLPCPFCGSEAVDRREVDGFPMIYCGGDDCFGPQTTARNFEDAVTQWNKRTRAVAAEAQEPVAFTNKAQLGYLKMSGYETAPMAMWAKQFHHVPFAAPFGSLDYLECLKYCNRKGARITIVDSMTHEHIGEGGYLETAENTITRILGDRAHIWKERQKVQMLGWATAGPQRQKMIEGIKQLDGAFIFCFRAKEKTKPVRNEKGDTEVVNMGFMPLAGEDWVYEMSLNCMLEPRSEGVPTWRSDHIGERMMMKLPTQFKSIFAEQKSLDESIGRALATWARGGSPASPTPAKSAAPVQSPPLPATGAADPIPTAAEYATSWHTIVRGATNADQLAATWNGQAELRKQIEWPDGEFNKLQVYVRKGIEQMRAPA